jgi:hypothetical protein
LHQYLNGTPGKLKGLPAIYCPNINRFISFSCGSFWIFVNALPLNNAAPASSAAKMATYA